VLAELPTTAAAEPQRGRFIRPVRPPGLLERLLVSFVVFINVFGTPADWFTENTGSASGPESDFLLSYGSLAIIIVLSFGLIGNGDALVKILTAEPLMTAYFFFIAISPLWSPRFPESVAAVVNFGAMLGLGVILLVRFRIHEMFGLLAVVFTIGILMDLFWVFAMGSLGRSGDASWDGLATQKNALGSHGVLGMVVFIMAARLFPRFRVPMYIMFALSTIVLVGSESKTSLGSAAVTIVSFTVFVIFRARKTLRGAVFLTVLSGVAMLLLLVTANLETFVGALGRDVTFSGRIGLWGECWEAIRAHPWIGYGYDGFWGGPLSDSFSIAAFREFDWGPTHAHNAFMESALHVGVPLTFLYAGFVLRGLYRATDHVQLVRGAIGMFPLVLLTLMFMGSFTESGIFTQRFGISLFLIATVMAKLGVDQAQQLGVMRLDEERQLKKAGYDVTAVGPAAVQ
jgi:O-antigen ligase